MNAYIIANKYYNTENKQLFIGGIETYITQLALLFINLGYNPIVIQRSINFFRCEINGILVHGVEMTKFLFIDKYRIKKTVQKTITNDDFLIFSTDYLIFKTKHKKNVAIQHGIAWDISRNSKTNLINSVIELVISFLKSLNKIFRYQKVQNLVCVDYNFINWYRTQQKNIPFKASIIPNFVPICDLSNKKENLLCRVIFARRFVNYRGTRLFAEAINNLYLSGIDFNVTFAGEGPDEMYLREKFLNEHRVEFIKFNSSEALEIFSMYDISIVPSIGSEGTSLTLLESMAVGCAVICTNVGGMTNIVIDNFNGLIVNPTVTDIQNALLKLIENRSIRNKIAENAISTAHQGFSLDEWTSRWIEVIKKIERGLL